MNLTTTEQKDDPSYTSDPRVGQLDDTYKTCDPSASHEKVVVTADIADHEVDIVDKVNTLNYDAIRQNIVDGNNVFVVFNLFLVTNIKYLL